jgi:hypothetical protein
MWLINHRQPSFINLGKPYAQQIFTVLIFGDDRPKFDFFRKFPLARRALRSL